MREDGGHRCAPRVPVARRYILAQLRTGLVVIDQQRALERILYERSMKYLESGSGTRQALLFPVTMELNACGPRPGAGPAAGAARLGLPVGTLERPQLRGEWHCPVEARGRSRTKLIEGLLEQVQNERGTLKAERHATLARGMARRLAYRGTRSLQRAEMHDLIDRLFACEMPYFTPGGRPVLITYGPWRNWQNGSTHDERGYGSGHASSASPVMTNLILINVLLCKMLRTDLGMPDLDEQFGLYAIGSPNFRPWQLVTHMFLHAGPGSGGDWYWHILSNMFALFMFGGPVERVIGSPSASFTYYIALRPRRGGPAAGRQLVVKRLRSDRRRKSGGRLWRRCSRRKGRHQAADPGRGEQCTDRDRHGSPSAGGHARPALLRLPRHDHRGQRSGLRYTARLRDDVPEPGDLPALAARSPSRRSISW
jgi:hypothetical protein